MPSACTQPCLVLEEICELQVFTDLSFLSTTTPNLQPLPQQDANVAFNQRFTSQLLQQLRLAFVYSLNFESHNLILLDFLSLR